MNTEYFGVLSLVPPMLSMFLAVKTKNIIFSLISGTFVGVLIYVLFTGQNILFAPMEIFFDTIVDNVDLYVILFCMFLGAIIFVLNETGATKAYGNWMGKRIKSKKATIIVTWLLGLAIQIDDYFHCLTVGTVMRPLADKYNISKEKLAYLVDCMAAPVCVLSPISSWSVAIASTLFATGIFANGFKIFCQTIPYNIYPIMTIVLSLLVGYFSLDFGKMKVAESKNKKENAVSNENGEKNIGKVRDVVIVIVTLISTSLLSMIYTGGFWGDDPLYRYSLINSLGNCDASRSLCWSSFLSFLLLTISIFMRREVKLEDYISKCIDGIKTMTDASLLLVMSWTLSSVCRDLLMTPNYVSDLLMSANVDMVFFPAIIFIVASMLSVSMGTAWGTFFILLPIVAPVVNMAAPELMILSISATLGGSVWGDHCSPISDTTILSSVGTGCKHVSHVETQVPYAFIVGLSSLIGYFVSGILGGKLLVLFASSVVSLVILFVLCLKFLNKKSDTE